MIQTSNYISGLIIKEESIGEKAKLLHILTSNQGIVKMKAPGAKNLKSSTHSAVQLFTYSEFSFARGRNGYFTITGAVAKNSFFGLRNNVLCYALACYLSSAVSKVAVNDSSSSEVLRLLLNCFYALSELKIPPETVKPFFETKLASVCGFTPVFNACTSCGEKVDTMYFDFFSSGMICKKCALLMGTMIKSRRFFQLTPKSLYTIEKLSKCDMKKMFSLNAYLSNESDSGNFRAFSEAYICNLFEYEPKTLSFYNHLMRSVENEKLRQKQKNT